MLKLWLLYFIAFPFLYNETLYEVYGLRVALFYGLVAVHCMNLSFTGLSKIQKLKPDLLDMALGLWVSLRFVSYLALHTVLNNPPPGWLYGLDTLMLESAAYLFYLCLRLEAPNSEFYKKLGFGMIISHLAVVCLQWGWSDFSWVRELSDGRYNGSYFHPNVFAILTVAVFSLIWFDSARGCKMAQRTDYHWYALILTLIILWLSASKNAILGLGVLLFFRSKFRWLILIAGALFFFLFLQLRSNVSPEESFRNKLSHSVSIRLTIFQSTLFAISQNPAGLGTGQYATRIHSYVKENLHSYFPHPKQHSLNKAHNFALEWICESGWLMIPVLLLIAWILYYCPFNHCKAALSITALCSLGSVHLNYPEGFLFFSLLLAGMNRDFEEIS